MYVFLYNTIKWPYQPKYSPSPWLHVNIATRKENVRTSSRATRSLSSNSRSIDSRWPCIDFNICQWQHEGKRISLVRQYSQIFCKITRSVIGMTSQNGIQMWSASKTILHLNWHTCVWDVFSDAPWFTRRLVFTVENAKLDTVYSQLLNAVTIVQINILSLPLAFHSVSLNRMDCLGTADEFILLVIRWRINGIMDLVRPNLRTNTPYTFKKKKHSFIRADDANIVYIS